MRAVWILLSGSICASCGGGREVDTLADADAHGDAAPPDATPEGDAQPDRPPAHTDLEVYARDLVVMDIDGDRRLDLAIAAAADRLVVFLDDGAGGRARVESSVPGLGSRITPADLDGDGDVDLASGGDWDQIVWMRNLRDGLFSVEPGPNLTRCRDRIAAADWDDDGDVDLACGGAEVFPLLRNDGAGRFEKTYISTAGDDVCYVVPIDADSDGDLDLAGPACHNWGVLHLWNDGFGNLGALSYTGENGYDAVEPGDIDGDGRGDLVVASWWWGDWRGFAWKRQSLAGFVEEIELPWQGHFLAVLDFDGDGDLDGLTLAGGRYLDAAKNDGTGSFSPPARHRILDNTLKAVVMDWNGDGVPDLVGAREWPETAYVILGIPH